tara:strand:+ start:72 stop:338 length:267 start_codon:yes stop_codon:yes gene_type:complete
MKVKILGPNQTLLDLEEGSEAFFSYETPVAGFDRVIGYWQTSEHYSKTTTKHINEYFQRTMVGRRFAEACQLSIHTLSPEEIDFLTKW